MAMLRAFSVRNHRRYERLEQPIDEPEVSLLRGKLPRTTSVPAQFLSRKLTPESGMPSNSRAKSTKKSKSHPLFSLFDGRRHRRKTTAKPEFARYLEYVKEGGVWDRSSDMPAIYYK